MRAWIKGLKGTQSKRPLPILSFPSVSLLGVSVRELISDSALQAEGMRLVAEHTDAAAAVSLMDLSVEAECFGAEVCVFDDEVPTVKGRLVHDMDEAEALEIPAVGSGRTHLYIDAIKKATALIVDRPVFAGMIGPFSLAARLFDVSEIMMECYDDPDTVHTVLEKTCGFIISYCKAYKEIGAHGVVLAEPVAGLLSPALVREFSEPYVKRIVSEVQDNGFAVIYHNCGDNLPRILDSVLETGATAYHFGNAVDMEQILRALPEGVIAMGNIDPVRAFCEESAEYMYGETKKLLQRCAPLGSFVLSSGCDVPHGAKWENIDAFYRALKDFNKEK